MAATVVQQLCKSCRTCFMFYCMFYFNCDRYFSGHDNSAATTRTSVVCQYNFPLGTLDTHRQTQTSRRTDKRTGNTPAEVVSQPHHQQWTSRHAMFPAAATAPSHFHQQTNITPPDDHTSLKAFFLSTDVFKRYLKTFLFAQY